MDKLILCFVGLIASGKDAAKKHLETKYDAKSYRFSSVLRDALDCLGIETKRDNLITLSTWARNTFGNDLLAKAIAKKAKESDARLVIIDGARRIDDLKYLKEFDNFFVVSISADEKTRYKRSVARNENPGDKEKTFEEFLADHEKETEITIPETMAIADFEIDNNYDFDNLYQKIDEIIDNLKWKINT